MTDSIVILIDPTHPDYRRLLKLLTAPESGSAGHVTIEQSRDGIWSSRLSIVSPRPNSLHYKSCLVQIGIANASIFGAFTPCAPLARHDFGGSDGIFFSSEKSK